MVAPVSPYRIETWSNPDLEQPEEQKTKGFFTQKMVYHWKTLLKAPPSQELIPEQDFIVSNAQTVVLGKPKITVLRDVVVISNKLIFMSKKSKYKPHLIFRDIYVLGGEIEFQGISHVTFRYIIQMTFKQFSKEVTKLSKKTFIPFPFMRRVVPLKTSLEQNFVLTDDINGCDGEGSTALITAARYQDHEVAELLLGAKANPNIKNNDGWCALKFAALNNCPNLMKLLVRAKANLEVRDSSESTALITASAHNHVSALKSLLSAHANVHAKNKFGRNALSAATKAGAVESVKLLIEAGADINDCLSDPGHMSAKAMYAAANGLSDVMESLIDAGLDTEATNDACQTPLLLAARYGHARVAAQLIEANANIEAHILGETVLMKAVREGHVNVVELLIEKRANLRTEDLRGTALKSAAEKTNVVVLHLLIHADIEGAVDCLVKNFGNKTITNRLLSNKMLQKWMLKPNSYGNIP